MKASPNESQGVTKEESGKATGWSVVKVFLLEGKNISR